MHTVQLLGSEMYPLNCFADAAAALAALHQGQHDMGISGVTCLHLLQLSAWQL